ncbi:MAG: hypothetical protein ABEJ42_05365 [Halobacteriaceae archaeon]
MSEVKLHALGRPVHGPHETFQRELLSLAHDLDIPTTRWPTDDRHDAAALYERFVRPLRSDTPFADEVQESRLYRRGDAYDVDGQIAVTADDEPVGVANPDTFYTEFRYLSELARLFGPPALRWLHEKLRERYEKYRAEQTAFDVVVTSHGTVDEEDRMDDAERREFQSFVEDHTTVVMTGWNLSDKGDEIVDTYDPDVIVTEGGTFAHPAPEFDPQPLFEACPTVRRGTAAALRGVAETLGEDAVVLSQANTRSTCLYVNPPRDLYATELRPQQAPEDRSVEHLRFELDEQAGVEVDVVSASDDVTEIPATDHAVYQFEKYQATSRPFRPYRILEFSGDHVRVQLCSEEVFETRSYSSLTESGSTPPSKLVEIAHEARDEMPDEHRTRVQPQTDYCIDVFARKKSEALDGPLPDIAGFDVSTDNVVYVSKGTRSDVGLIEEFQETAERNGTEFAAMAPDDAPAELQTHELVTTWDVETPAEILRLLESRR